MDNRGPCNKVPWWEWTPPSKESLVGKLRSLGALRRSHPQAGLRGSGKQHPSPPIRKPQTPRPTPSNGRQREFNGRQGQVGYAGGLKWAQILWITRGRTGQCLERLDELTSALYENKSYPNLVVLEESCQFCSLTPHLHSLTPTEGQCVPPRTWN